MLEHEAALSIAIAIFFATFLIDGRPEPASIVVKVEDEQAPRQIPVKTRK